MGKNIGPPGSFPTAMRMRQPTIGTTVKKVKQTPAAAKCGRNSGNNGRRSFGGSVLMGLAISSLMVDPPYLPNRQET